MLVCENKWLPESSVWKLQSLICMLIIFRGGKTIEINVYCKYNFDSDWRVRKG